MLEKIEYVVNIEVQPGQKPKRLDSYVADSIEKASRTRVQSAIENGTLKVNGKLSRPSYKVKPGDVITLTYWKHPPLKLIPEDIVLDIVAEDDDILVINKKAGILTHPGIGNSSGTLVNAVLWHLGYRTPLNVLDERLNKGEWQNDVHTESDETDLDDAMSDYEMSLSDEPTHPLAEQSAGIRPGIIHRLDRDTTGLMVIGKNYNATLGLATQFKNRTTSRLYQAIVWGRLKNTSGAIETNLGRDSRNRKLQAVLDIGGRFAKTEFSVVEQHDFAAFVTLKLFTGRTHQIRVHMSSIGHPVLGDKDYGGRDEVIGKLHHAYRRDAAALLGLIDRQALHAFHLGFTHPVTGERQEYYAPIPDDMSVVLDKISQISARNSNR